MKRFISFLLLLSLLFSIHAVTVVHISDPHYLSSSLFDYERLRNLMMKSDGKATHIMDKVMDADAALRRLEICLRKTNHRLML